MTRAAGLALALCVLTQAARAKAACPADVADCLGAANGFELIAAESFTAKPVRIPGASYKLGTRIAGRGCARTAVLSGQGGVSSSVVHDLVLLASSGIAGRFRGTRFYPANRVSGDLVTAGGAISGLDRVQVDGVVNTTGTHPAVTECAQATADMQAASAMLAALTPTQDAGALEASGTVLIITAGPGVNVIRASTITLRSGVVGFYELPGRLRIVGDPATESVIINTERLLVPDGDIQTMDLAPERVIVNVTGTKPVRFGDQASIAGRILAPNARIDGRDIQTAPLYGRNVKLRGSLVSAPAS
jgi:choice-of-anchor A domain-containing protein